MNGLAIIYEALLLDGVTYPGQTASPEALSTSETGLNNMLAEWNAQGLAVYSVIKEAPLTLVSGTGDYAIGTGATFNVPRPEKIEAWRVIDSSGAANGGKPVDSATFAAQADDDTLTSALVKLLNYDAAFPTGTIHLFPKPNGGTLELWVWEQLVAIADWTSGATDIALPTGYLKAICYNLAVDLAPKFGRPLDQTVLMIANSTKATLGATNISEMTRIPKQ